MAKAGSPAMHHCRCRGGDGRLTYRADPAGGLRMVPLDSLTAIYHRASGQTHIVSEPVPEILATLSTGEVEIPALLERLNLPDTDDRRALLSERLQELLGAGLVVKR